MIIPRLSWPVLSAGAAAAAFAALAGLRRLHRRRRPAAAGPGRSAEVENRKSDRIPLAVPVTVHRLLPSGRPETRSLWSKDVSEDGILLMSECPAALELGETVSLEVGPGGPGTELGKAVVARIDSEYDSRGTFLRCAYGLKFLEPGSRLPQMQRHLPVPAAQPTGDA